MKRMVTREELEAETRAYKDFLARVARNDPDWGIYLGPDEAPPKSWWRRFLNVWKAA